MEWRLFLQAYVGAGAYGEAFAVARDLIGRIAPTAMVAECRVRPYPKFEDQYGVWLDLRADDPSAAFEALQSDLAPGWSVEAVDGERFAIWDRRQHGPAPLPSLRWLHLNLYPEPEPEDGVQACERPPGSLPEAFAVQRELYGGPGRLSGRPGTSRPRR